VRGLIGTLATGGSRLGDGNGASLSGQELLECATTLADELVAENVRCAGIRLDNGIEWVCADLACILAGIPAVPVPLFFTQGQVNHLVQATGMDALLGTITGAEMAFASFRPRGREVPWWAGPRLHCPVPTGVAKVSFTSGTTGSPRGVCLPLASQEEIAATLAASTRSLGMKRHLAVLPLAVLLENVAGVYGAFLSGAEVALPPLARLGIRGSSAFDPSALLDVILEWRPDSLILLPQMLKGLVAELKRRSAHINGLKLLSVGGARTAPDLILEARALGLPVYEGYGLTEACSVVSLNLPGADRPGSVGRVLPSRSVRISPIDEIEVFLPDGVHYLGESPAGAGWMPTGDLGQLDRNGYLYVHGRRKQVLVTAFGRKVSPEWVESELLAECALMQAVAVGDDQPALAALVVPAPGACAQDVAHAIERCNGRLPDYARIAAWRTVPPLTVANGMLTPNGRIRRAAVHRQHAGDVAALCRKLQMQSTGANHDVLPEAHPGH